MSTINKIKVGNTEYDIEALAIGNLSNLTIQSSETVPEVAIKSGNKSNSSLASFETASTADEAVEGKVNGVVELNAKGNLAVESLNKHVNLEAAKSIQIKPTTNVIFDSSRRIKAEEGNEVHLEFKFDDYKDPPKSDYVGKPGNDEQYAELKVEARNIDLRCLDHGGIALQPCGEDGDNFENKIKFESSRQSALGDTPIYATVGGKGLEFGTFNNEHTSLFTGDYRFNKDGMVYAVTRDTPVLVNDKFDYPTQEDDFKDVVDTNLGVSWEILVKTAMVFDALSDTTTYPNQDATDLMAAYNSIFNPTPSI